MEKMEDCEMPQKQLDRRDRRLLKEIWICAELALSKQGHGHSDCWQKLRDALNKANDEIGDCEDFQP